MNVLSLFDGISCGKTALDRAEVHVNNYFASEIDKHAIRVSQANHPSIVQLGCVKGVSAIGLPKIDILLGGFPCQAFSFSGKQLNFQDERGKLFYECARLLKECKPTYFLFENVIMKKEFQDIISEYLGVQPIEINSSLVSAQNRRRLYWTNIPNISQPEDKGISLSCILDKGPYSPVAIRGRRLDRKATIIGRRLNAKGRREDYNKEIPTTQCLEVSASNTDKSNCLTTVAKDNVLTSMPIGRHPNAFKDNLPFRYYSLTEYCRLQTIPEDYFDGCASVNQARKAIGNGWTVDVIAHILRAIPTDKKKGDSKMEKALRLACKHNIQDAPEWYRQSDKHFVQLGAFTKLVRAFYNDMHSSAISIDTCRRRLHKLEKNGIAISHKRAATATRWIIAGFIDS